MPQAEYAYGTVVLKTMLCKTQKLETVVLFYQTGTEKVKLGSKDIAATPTALYDKMALARF